MSYLKKCMAVLCLSSVLASAPAAMQADEPNSGFLGGENGKWIGLSVAVTVITVAAIMHSNNRGIEE